MSRPGGPVPLDGERSTGRLRLRPVTLADLDTFVALEAALRRQDHRSGHLAVVPDPARYLADVVAVWDRGELGCWVVSAAERVVGFGGVQPAVRHGAGCWDLSYRVDPGLWGCGIATELAREAVAVASTVHPLWPVVVRARPTDAAAIRVAERAGCVRSSGDGGVDDVDEEGYVVLVRPPRSAAAG